MLLDQYLATMGIALPLWGTIDMLLDQYLATVSIALPLWGTPHGA